MRIKILMMFLAYLLTSNFTYAEKIDFYGLWIKTEIPPSGPSGTVTVVITCAIVSEGICYTVVTPGMLPSPSPKTNYQLANNQEIIGKNCTIIANDGVASQYKGNIQWIQAEEFHTNGEDFINMTFNITQ